MEESRERKPRRIFTPEQKYEILKDVERYATIKEGLEKYGFSSSVYSKLQRQLMVGIHASLRNSRPIKPADMRRVEAENRKLKEIVLNQSLTITTNASAESQRQGCFLMRQRSGTSIFPNQY